MRLQITFPSLKTMMGGSLIPNTLEFWKLCHNLVSILMIDLHLTKITCVKSFPLDFPPLGLMPSMLLHSVGKGKIIGLMHLSPYSLEF